MQCIVVKDSQRCQADSATTYGLTIPIVKPEAKVFLCATCILDLSFAVTQHEPMSVTPQQAKKEMGLS